MTFAQNRRRKIIVLQSLWSKICPLGDQEYKRDARLAWLSKLFDRPVASANDLSDRELEQAIQQMMHEVKPRSKVQSPKSKVAEFPNRTLATREQAWKIRQLERWLGWHTVPERLEGFLLSKFGARRPEQLIFRQAWGAIEALFNIAAAARLRAKLGGQAKLSRKALRAEKQLLKDQLHYWRPPEAS